MITAQIACFRLGFDSSGKLASLSLPGNQQILARSDYPFDLGDGRIFTPSGWDECFPTIDPFEGSGVMGDLVAWPPVIERAKDRLVQTWRMPRYIARRTFTGRGDSALELVFEAVNHSKTPLKFLWASHGLFDAAELESVQLPDGQALTDFSNDGTCRKFFTPAGAQPARLQGRGYCLELQTDQPHWGIWLNRGGWPTGKPADLCCVGLEATNTAGETPRRAVLEPAASFRGLVTVQLT